jgi:putative RNA 2'-phosphotransferase
MEYRLMTPQNTIKLSKMMSLALRHDPASFNLTLDEEGWVSFNTFVSAIAARPGWHWVQAEHIQQVVETSDKRRFEIKEQMIRARYGHSQAARPTYQAVDPPSILYHGTPRRNLAAIRRHGLKAMNRQYVHLSATPEMALQVGRRRDDQPALLIIHAAKAHAAGVVFGTPSGTPDNVYLVEAMPAEFIEFPS